MSGDDKEAEFVRIIADGGTFRSAAAELGVSTSTLCRWLADPERVEFRERYARAREAQGDAYADAVIDTVLDPMLDPTEKRVRMDAFKWAAGKRKPKVYGDKITQEHTGKDGGAIVTEATNDPARLAREVAFLLAAGATAKSDA
jgi:hypothetical protein